MVGLQKKRKEDIASHAEGKKFSRPYLLYTKSNTNEQYQVHGTGSSFTYHKIDTTTDQTAPHVLISIILKLVKLEYTHTHLTEFNESASVFFGSFIKFKILKSHLVNRIKILSVEQ